MLPDFNTMTAQEVHNYLHIPVKRVCGKCGGKKERGNGNSYYCNACLDNFATQQIELAKSRAEFEKFAKNYPNLSFNELVTLYEAR